MDYIVITESSSWKLTKAVKVLLAEGWKPQGGVSVAIDQGSETYVQAMIKE